MLVYVIIYIYIKFVLDINVCGIFHIHCGSIYVMNDLITLKYNVTNIFYPTFTHVIAYISFTLCGGRDVAIL